MSIYNTTKFWYFKAKYRVLHIRLLNQDKYCLFMATRNKHLKAANFSKTN